jgi:hypothetical protein
MTDRLRMWLAAALLALPFAALPPDVATQAPLTTSPWQIGDVFAGVGMPGKNPGTYVVLNPGGTHTGQTLVDPFETDEPGTTTGCVVEFDSQGEALFGTTFAGRTVVRFDALAPHAASTAVALGTSSTGPVPYEDLYAFESIAFDGDPGGYYYVAGNGPLAQERADYVDRRGLILKFDRQHALVDAHDVPADQSGVDWIDVGSDRRTLYYTSEGPPYDIEGQPIGGASIHVFNPDLGHQRLQVTYEGAPYLGRLQAMRLLPPMPGDPDLKPSGFLVATSDLGVFRLDAHGVVIARYEVPGLVGSYYALNLTPDGQSFWTATYQRDPFWAEMCPGGSDFWEDFPEDCALYDPETDDFTRPPPEPEGKIVRFHIPSGAITAGPIAIQLNGTPVDNVWGLCVKREYTAASNTCYELDQDGHAVLDDAGQPIPVTCRVPVFCPADPSHPDCADPAAPIFIPPPDQHHFEGEAVELQLGATVGAGKTATFVIGGLPPGLSADASGLITGTISYLAAGVVYVVSVTVYDGPAGEPGTRSVSGRFEWHITNVNGPPTISAPPAVTIPVGVPVTPIVFPTSDPDLDSLVVTTHGLPPGLTAPALVAAAPAPPYAYTLALTGTPTLAGVFTPTLCVWDQQHGRDPVCVTGFITVVENRPPVCTGAVPSQALWPPNHKFVPVTILGVTDPDGDPITIAITGIQQDEPVLAPGSGQTAYDGIIDGATALVRAERMGGGDGRVYEIFFTVSDGIASCSGSVTVGIPHDQGNAGKPGQKAPVDSGFRYDSLTGAVIIGPASIGSGRRGR